MTLNIRPYTNILRKQTGWIFDGDSRAGGTRIVVFKKEFTDRTLEVQLWGDGVHRIAIWHKNIHSTIKSESHGRHNMVPVSFRTPEEMLIVVESQLSRDLID